MFSQLKNRFVCAMALATGLLLVGCKEDPLSLPIFHEISSPTPYDLTAVWFADSLCGYLTAGAAWTRGELWSTIDGGVHWQLDTAVGSRLEGVVFDADGNGYACGQDGLLLLRYAGTAHWYPVRYDYVWHRSCAFRNLGQGLIVSGEGFQGGGIRKLGPDAPWSLDTTLLFPNALSSLCYSDSQTVHAVGLGWVLRSTDGGRHWVRLPPTGDFFRAVHFPSVNTGFICGNSGTLLKTSDGGASWQTLRFGGSLGKAYQPFRALRFVSEKKGYLVGDKGLFWRTENGGVDWAPLAGLPENLDAAAIFTLDHRGWICTDGGRLFYFED